MFANTFDLYGTIGAGILILILGGAVLVQTNRVEAKQTQIDAMKMIAQSWEQKVDAQRINIETLKRAIAEQNKTIEDMARLGELAAERQRTIDELMAKLARAESDLRLISDKYRQMREESATWTVCETYERVLRSLATEATP